MKIIYVAIGIVLGAFAGVALSAPPANVPKAFPAKEVSETVSIEMSATSSISIPKYNTRPFNEPTLQGQGDCFALHDSDGNGITYVTANSGVLSANSTGC